MINDNDLADHVKGLLIRIIDQLPELDLSALEYIVIPDDFGKEMGDFQKKYGLPVGYTNNEFGVAMGKALSYIDGDQMKVSIFIDPKMIYLLFDEENRQKSIHLIHHELCHVHDDKIKYKAFGVIDLEELFMKTPDKVRQVSYAHADLIWSEYIATRLSASSKPDGHTHYVDSLVTLLPETKEKCDKAIQSYLNDDGIETKECFNEIQLTCSLLLKIVAYFLGYCHASDIDPPKEINEHVKQFPYLNGVWEELSPTLHKMYSTYGNWVSAGIYSCLAKHVLRLWENLGVYPKNHDGGLSATFQKQ